MSLAKELVVAQRINDLLAVGQFSDLPAAVDQDDLLVALVDVRVFDDADEWCEPGAGGQQQQPFSRQQIVGDQRSGRLAADQNDIALFDPLQFRRQRAVLDLDAEEFKRLFVIGAGHAVSPQQRPAVDFKPHHGELSGRESESPDRASS